MSDGCTTKSFPVWAVDLPLKIARKSARSTVIGRSDTHEPYERMCMNVHCQKLRAVFSKGKITLLRSKVQNARKKRLEHVGDQSPPVGSNKLQFACSSRIAGIMHNQHCICLFCAAPCKFVWRYAQEFREIEINPKREENFSSSKICLLSKVLRVRSSLHPLKSACYLAASTSIRFEDTTSCGRLCSFHSVPFIPALIPWGLQAFFSYQDPDL